MSLKTVPSPRGVTGMPHVPMRESYPHRLDPEPPGKTRSLLPLVAAAALSWLAIWACVLAVMDAIR